MDDVMCNQKFGGEWIRLGRNVLQCMYWVKSSNSWTYWQCGITFCQNTCRKRVLKMMSKNWKSCLKVVLSMWWCNFLINRRWWYNCLELHVYLNICITKLWAKISVFLYIYMVFFQHYFHSEQHFFPSITYSFQCYTNISNWLSLVLNSIYFSRTELFFHRLSCIMSPFLYNCFLSVVKSHHDIFYSWS